MSTTQFRLTRQAENSTDGPDIVRDLNIVRRDILDGSLMTVQLDDTDGSRGDDYPRGQRVDVEYSTDGGSSWSILDNMAVVEPNDTSSAPLVFEAEFFDYGWFLRRSVVDRSENDTISNILETIIKNDTPITWDASHVTVDNDTTITREWASEPAIEAIDELSRRSNDEDYGVNSDFEFTFASSATSSATAITDNDWIDYKLPTSGKRAINKVIAKFAGGNQVTATNQSDQDSLETELGASRDVELVDVINLPDVTNSTVAQDKADAWLDRNKATTRGWIEVPIGRFDTDPGNDIDVTIDEKGLSAETFTVAAVKHEWKRGITTVFLGKSDDYLSDRIKQQSRTGQRSSNRLTANLTYQNDGSDLSTDARLINASTGITATEPNTDQIKTVLDESVIKDGGAKEVDAAELAAAMGSANQLLQTDGAAASWANPSVDVLSDVASSSESAGDVLIWDATDTQFENSPLTGGNAITITNGDASITIAVPTDGIGTDELDQSADYTFTAQIDLDGGAEMGGDIVPDADASRSVGTSGTKFDQMHSRELTGEDSVLTGRTLEAGDSVTVGSDESFVVSKDYTVDGTLTINGSMTVVG